MDALPPSLPNAGLPPSVPAGQAGLAILLADLSEALAKLPADTALSALVTLILPQPTRPDSGAANPSIGTLVQVSTPTRHWEAASIPVEGSAQGLGDGDWRTLMIPLMMGGEITNLRLTVRQRRGKSAAGGREPGTRFLLDIDLSRLGPIQFDGLVKRQHKRFDLIIRTLSPLSGEMRRDIDALFVNGLLNFGLEGAVAFRPDGRFVTTSRVTGTGNGIIFA